ncbi:hypothetical protein GCM10010517_56130 [Streptosporangium fragile]|uniref:Phage shock protein PspC N-terminal domain-containing protein n=2 Tax=Streptosporangium fragile TaxID=46186 RepID=A0ABN3W4C6_9ACTN
MLTGVCAGLGRYTGIDPVLFRVGFAVLVLGSGIGIMLYIAAFLLMRETDGGPGHLEQWTRREIDSETVLALLAGVFAFGLIINISSGGIGTGTVVVGTLFAVALLAAHARGVDLLALTRSLPDRLRRRRPPRAFGQAPGAFAAPGRVQDPFTTAGAPASAPFTTAAPAGTPAPAPFTTAARQDAAPADARTVTEPYEPAAPAPGPTAPGPAGPESAAEAPPSPGGSAAPAAPAPAGPESAAEAPPDSGGSAAPAPGPTAPGPGRGRMYEDPYRPAGPSYDSSGEPFSPYGPYQPLDPRRRQGYPSYGPPYAPAGYGPPTRTALRPRRPRSFVGGVTICLAMIVGGIIVAIQSASGPVNMTVAGGAMLVVIGGGLLVAAWIGRGAALVAAGTILSIALIAGSTVGGMPRKFGTYDWHPVKLSDVARSYSVGVGEGSLDLSELSLPPGSRTIVDASVSVGEISVILPATVRAEVHGFTKFGDVKIDHTVEGGADVQHRKILEPEVPPAGDVATIVLNVRAGIGDVEVRRAA